MTKKPWELLAETNDVAEGEPRAEPRGEGATSQNQIFTEWLGRQGSNLGMQASKARALPLGYAPKCEIQNSTPPAGGRNSKLKATDTL